VPFAVLPSAFVNTAIAVFSFAKTVGFLVRKLTIVAGFAFFGKNGALATKELSKKQRIIRYFSNILGKQFTFKKLM
jgi:ABC-type nickel/cobalt efflux system permease component RcnA